MGAATGGTTEWPATGLCSILGGGLFSARDGGGWGMLEGTGGGFQRVLPLGRRSSGRRQWE